MCLGFAYVGALALKSYAWGSRVCDRVAFLGQSTPEKFKVSAAETGRPQIFRDTIASNAADCCVHIAHAGGGVEGTPYTNSLEALTENYARGVRLFEIDFAKTVNGDVVIAHDFNDLDSRPVSEQEFLETEARHGYGRLSFAEFVDWMTAHPDARVVTDTKFDSGPQRILDEFERYLSTSVMSQQLIVQARTLEEYFQAVDDERDIPVIFTMYRMSDKNFGAVIDALEQHPPLALTLPVSRAPKLMQWARWHMPQLPIYVHGAPEVINESEVHVCMEALGASGFYLDW